MVPGARGRLKRNMFGTFDRFLVRLESKINDIRYDFLLKPRVRTSSSSLSALLRDFVGLGSPKSAVTVIDLSSVPFDVRPTVSAQIGRLAFEFNYWNPDYRDFPVLLICEEAHVYIPRESEKQFAGSRKSMERIAKEGRKYGVGLAVVSQRPHEVSEQFLHNAARSSHAYNEPKRSGLCPQLGTRERGRLGQRLGGVGTRRGTRFG